ncbi:Unannotated [Lentimonas sp. CC19]|nr:Unannotated [Lentimonas sp. CC19]CAA6694721.1 Unannotated [Lentimonas sp. CC10]CAA7071544.1 Unannotated [Lentimonas sp. CC11]
MPTAVIVIFNSVLSVIPHAERAEKIKIVNMEKYFISDEQVILAFYAIILTQIRSNDILNEIIQLLQCTIIPVWVIVHFTI